MKSSTRARQRDDSMSVGTAPREPSRGPTRRIHRRIADQLAIDIVSGRYPPGTVLPKEVQASAKLRVSRSAYREAVRILTAKGLVESRPKAGTRVSDRQRWNFLDPDVLAWVFSSEPSEAFVRSLFELREMVEPQAAALAAQRRTSEQLARMGHALEQMTRHGLTTPEGRAADESFHEEILKAAGNEPLLSLTSSIGAAIRWTTIFKQRRRRLPRDPTPEHRRLYAAIAEGNGRRATEAARELIQLALQDTRGSFESIKE